MADATAQARLRLFATDYAKESLSNFRATLQISLIVDRKRLSEGHKARGAGVCGQIAQP